MRKTIEVVSLVLVISTLLLGMYLVIGRSMPVPDQEITLDPKAGKITNTGRMVALVIGLQSEESINTDGVAVLDGPVTQFVSCPLDNEGGPMIFNVRDSQIHAGANIGEYLILEYETNGPLSPLTKTLSDADWRLVRWYQREQ